MSTETDTVLQTLADQQAALHAGDAESVVSYYAPDVRQFDLAPPLQKQGEGVRDVAGLRDWLGTFDGPVDTEFRDLSVTAEGDVAFCHGLKRLSAVPKGSSESFELWMRVTFGLRRVDGTWTITHEHESTPFHMDGSFLAATDLRP